MTNSQSIKKTDNQVIGFVSNSANEVITTSIYCLSSATCRMRCCCC